MINNTQYIYAVVNYDRGVVVHYACDALAALFALRELADGRIQTGRQEYGIYRLPILAFGNGYTTRFVNLGDIAGYVYVDYQQGQYVADTLYKVIYKSLATGQIHTAYFDNIGAARLAHTAVWERGRDRIKDLKMMRTWVFDVNPTEYDTRYFKLVSLDAPPPFPCISLQNCHDMLARNNIKI